MVKCGHEDALSVLLRRHSDALYRFCCHLMTTREDAEDVCQETLARAITRVETLQTGSAFRSWLFSIARNLSVDSYRSTKRTCAMPDEEALPLPLYGDSAQDRIEIREEHQTVVEALGKLTQSHQRVLVLREVDGLSYAEIANQLDVSQSAVETLLFRARRRLKEEYAKVGVPLVAILGGLRDVALRLMEPAVAGPQVAKVAVSTVLVGSAMVAAPHVLPQQHTHQNGPSAGPAQFTGTTAASTGGTATQSATVAQVNLVQSPRSYITPVGPVGAVELPSATFSRSANSMIVASTSTHRDAPGPSSITRSSHAASSHTARPRTAAPVTAATHPFGASPVAAAATAARQTAPAFGGSSMTTSYPAVNSSGQTSHGAPVASSQSGSQGTLGASTRPVTTTSARTTVSAPAGHGFGTSSAQTGTHSFGSGAQAYTPPAAAPGQFGTTYATPTTPGSSNSGRGRH